MTWKDKQLLFADAYNGKAAPSEHELQVACVNWFRLVYPEYLIYAIPNGGYRAATTAKLMKAEGQTAGIPDLHIPIARSGYNSLYIELKNGKAGRLSDHQKAMHEKLTNLGNKVAVVRDFEQFVKTTKEYFQNDYKR